MRSSLATITAFSLVLAADAARADTKFAVAIQAEAHLTPTADSCLLLNTETGTATSALLGDMTWSDLEVVSFFCAVEGGVGVVAQFTLAADDANKLYGTFETTGFPEADGQLHIEGTFRIVSGTGRFAGASGDGVISAVAEPPGPTGVGGVTGAMKGKIRLFE